MLRRLFGLIVLLALGYGAAYFVAGRGAPPAIAIGKPERLIGQTGSLEVTVEAPNARLTGLSVALEQSGKSTPLFVLDPSAGAPVFTQVDQDHVRITRPVGKRDVPDLQAGAARIVVSATRPSILNLRQLSTTATKDIQVRLEPPRIAVLSTHHYINHGGSEMVVYRVTPPDVASGVRVGDVEYPGFPIDGGAHAAFFALLWDQEMTTRMQVFARDEAGNEAKADFVDKVFPKPFKQSRIDLDDRFIDRVVPEILEHAPELKLTAPPQGEGSAAFLKINGELRRINADQIAAFAAKTSPKRLWSGPFVQLGNSQVEARFADQRTYFYKGQDIDRQVHLG